MSADAVHVVPYNPEWPDLYEQEAARLKAVLHDLDVLKMEHFGSTAVPGLPAKPVIDILVAVPDIEAARSSFPDLLAPLGYAFWADNPKTDRLFFVKGLPPSAPRRTHHVHITQTDGELWDRRLFRDHLREHPETAWAYADLKTRLACEHREDREAYTRAKADFMNRVMDQARMRDPD